MKPVLTPDIVYTDLRETLDKLDNVLVEREKFSFKTLNRWGPWAKDIAGYLSNQLDISQGVPSDIGKFLKNSGFSQEKKEQIANDPYYAGNLKLVARALNDGDFGVLGNTGPKSSRGTSFGGGADVGFEGLSKELAKLQDLAKKKKAATGTEAFYSELPPEDLQWLMHGVSSDPIPQTGSADTHVEPTWDGQTADEIRAELDQSYGGRENWIGTPEWTTPDGKEAPPAIDAFDPAGRDIAKVPLTPDEIAAEKEHEDSESHAPIKKREDDVIAGKERGQERLQAQTSEGKLERWKKKWAEKDDEFLANFTADEVRAQYGPEAAQALQAAQQQREVTPITFNEPEPDIAPNDTVVNWEQHFADMDPEEFAQIDPADLNKYGNGALKAFMDARLTQQANDAEGDAELDRIKSLSGAPDAPEPEANADEPVPEPEVTEPETTPEPEVATKPDEKVDALDAEIDDLNTALGDMERGPTDDPFANPDFGHMSQTEYDDWEKKYIEQEVDKMYDDDFNQIVSDEEFDAKLGADLDKFNKQYKQAVIDQPEIDTQKAFTDPNVDQQMQMPGESTADFLKRTQKIDASNIEKQNQQEIDDQAVQDALDKAGRGSKASKVFKKPVVPKADKTTTSAKPGTDISRGIDAVKGAIPDSVKDTANDVWGDVSDYFTSGEAGDDFDAGVDAVGDAYDYVKDGGIGKDASKLKKYMQSGDMAKDAKAKGKEHRGIIDKKVGDVAQGASDYVTKGGLSGDLGDAADWISDKYDQGSAQFKRDYANAQKLEKARDDRIAAGAKIKAAEKAKADAERLRNPPQPEPEDDRSFWDKLGQGWDNAVRGADEIEQRRKDNFKRSQPKPKPEPEKKSWFSSLW